MLQLLKTKPIIVDGTASMDTIASFLLNNYNFSTDEILEFFNGRVNENAFEWYTQDPILSIVTDIGEVFEKLQNLQYIEQVDISEYPIKFILGYDEIKNVYIDTKGDTWEFAIDLRDYMNLPSNYNQGG